MPELYLIATLPFSAWVLTAFMREWLSEIEETVMLNRVGGATLAARIGIALRAIQGWIVAGFAAGAGKV